MQGRKMLGWPIKRPDLFAVHAKIMRAKGRQASGNSKARPQGGP